MPAPSSAPSPHASPAHRPGAAPRFASWQLTLLPGLVVATLVISAWLLMHQQLRQQTRQQVSAQTAHRARLVAQHLALNLDQRVRQVEQLARDRALQPGEPLAGQQALLDLVVRGSAGIAWIGLLEPDGRVRAGSDRLLEGQSLAARPVYQQGRERLFVDGLHRAVMLADLLHPAQGGDLTLADVSLPLRNAQGQTAAVLAVHLDGAWFEQLVQQTLADTDAGSGLRVVVLGDDGEPVLGDRSAWGPAWRRIALPGPGAA
ncbi:MAG: cache domain-containing protein, partial [Leptothrix sp. (in: b-proteobacteria)]